jgi:hypothetical protein
MIDPHCRVLVSSVLRSSNPDICLAIFTVRVHF